MLKIIGMILILSSFTGMGISQRQQLNGRVRALDAMLTATDLIGSELAFRLTGIPDIIRMLTNDSRAQVALVFGKMQEMMKKDDGLSLTYKWMKAFRQYGAQAGLSEEDISVLCDMSDFIGKYDAASQKKCLDHSRKRLERQLEQARSELKSKGSVYRTCCIAAGILLVLVLI
ncbi:MAG: stage III sporulation protein AB [Butyricicoccaceae bacterium]